jgi:uncharacterized protein (TIGR03000 family)
MIGRRIFAAMALAATVALMLPSTGQAQWMRGGGGWRGGYWSGGWGGRGYYPYYYGYGYSPYWYGSSYANYYPWSYGNYVSPGTYQYQSAYPAGATNRMMTADQGAGVLARVQVPTADAKLWIEGQQMEPQGLERRFISPPIDPGSSYTYTIRAQWNDNGKPMEDTREVRVRPGDRITVDFTKPAPAKSAGPGTDRRSGYGPENGKDKNRIDRQGLDRNPPADRPLPKPATPPDDKPKPPVDPTPPGGGNTEKPRNNDKDQ